MPADFRIKQGDTQPALTDTLSYSNGQPVNLTGATVTLIARDPTETQPRTLTGHVIYTSRVKGEIAFAFSEQDTGKPGGLLANWAVVFPDGSKMSFPTDGYLWLEIEPNLVTQGTAAIVALTELKDHLNIPAEDRVHDTRLARLIETIRPMIELETGPIIPQIYNEWYEGGHPEIALRNYPAAGPGTTPILELLEVTEYRGPIPYELIVAGTPAEGQIFSVQADVRTGIITRRSTAGGVVPFWHNPQHGHQQVHVVYRAGQERVPDNVRTAAVETIREVYQTTMAVGRGSRTRADEEETPASLAQAFSVVGKRLLAPTRRATAIA